MNGMDRIKPEKLVLLFILNIRPILIILFNVFLYP